ncbi:MAG: phage recombination protein Bet [Solirubrobacteraceae bacterium]|nr:phage recombination protein Bet [Solirubrobacteraceae bacterium]
MTTALAARDTPTAQGVLQLSDEQVDLVTRTVAQGADRDELALFLHTAQRMGLDPLAKQIHAVKRWDSKARREVMAIQVGIDGLRLVADRTGTYLGQDGPFWCGDDGQWREVWTSHDPPVAAKVIVRRAIGDHVSSLPAVAHYTEYVATLKGGAPNRMWKEKPALMLAKCAEALALRKAFPADMSGVYTDDEMQQAGPPVQPAAPPVERATRDEYSYIADARAHLGYDDDGYGQLLTDAGIAPGESIKARLQHATRAQVAEVRRRLDAAADSAPEMVDGTVASDSDVMGDPGLEG